MKKRTPAHSICIALFMLPLITLMASAGFSRPEESDKEAQKAGLIRKFRAIFDLRDISDTEKLSKILGIEMEIETGELFDKFNKQDSAAAISWIDYFSNHNNRHRTMQSAAITLHINKDLLCIQRSDIADEFGKKYSQFYDFITDCCTIDGLRYEDKVNGHIHLTPEFRFRDPKCLENFSVRQVVRPD